MKKLISTICILLALTVCLAACQQSSASAGNGQSLAKGGILVLSVNPEIAIEYDESGSVTGVTARNDDALAIINSCTGLIGQPTREVVTDLITAIGDAGYFVEEIEGQRRQITLEIEPGSSLPNDAFLDDVISDIRELVSQHDWSAPLVMEGESDFGISDYIDTDYGVGNDGVTDYDDTDYDDGNSDYNDGNTDYNDGNTDYNDGNTDYNDGNSNYNDGNTDYNDGNTDYNDGNTDYNDGNSDYNDGNSDYNDGNSDYNNSDYGNSNYGNSNYDDGNSDYDDASDYGDSDYE